MTRAILAALLCLAALCGAAWAVLRRQPMPTAELAPFSEPWGDL